MKTIILTFLMLTLTISSSAQDRKQLVEITYETSITCDNCVNTIMESLPLEKGVKNVKCDLDSKEVKVTVKNNKTDAKIIQRAIEKLGYTAKKTSEKVLKKGEKSKDAK